MEDDKLKLRTNRLPVYGCNTQEQERLTFELERLFSSIGREVIITQFDYRCGEFNNWTKRGRILEASVTSIKVGDELSSINLPLLGYLTGIKKVTSAEGLVLFENPNINEQTLLRNLCDMFDQYLTNFGTKIAKEFYERKI